MPIRRPLLTGLALAALGAAPLVTLLHVYLNDLRSVPRVLALLAISALVYASALVPLAAFGEAARSFWLKRQRSLDPSPESTTRRPIPVAGFFAALFPFAVVLYHYGRTYEETLLFEPSGWLSMTTYIAVVTILIAVVCWLASLGLSRLTTAIHEEGRLGQLCVIFAALIVVFLVVSALVQPTGEKEATRLSPGDIRTKPTDTKLVVIGLDGLDPDVIDELIEQGQMPALARLRKGGVWGRLETIEDANSAVIWASIYTGRAPEDHGVHDFYRLRLPLVGEIFPVHRTAFKELLTPFEWLGVASKQPIERRDLDAFPVWEIADYFGTSTGVVDGYLYSYPAYRATTAGSWFLTYGMDSFVNHAEATGGVLAEQVGLYMQPVDLLPPARLPRQPDFFWQRNAILDLFEEREQPQLVNFYTHQPDALQHQRWPEIEPTRFPPFLRAADEETSETAIRDLHREFDIFLSQITRAADAHTAFLLVSDHGHAATLTHKLRSQHRHGPPGVFFAWGGPFERGKTLDQVSVYDIAPTVLRLLGLPTAEDMPGRVLLEAIRRPFLQKTTGLEIDTYDGLFTPQIQAVERSPEMRQRELEKLKAMGYL